MPRVKTQAKNYVKAFAGAMSALYRADENAGAMVVDILSADFDAERVELWLWDEASGCCYLAHIAGTDARRGLEYAPADSGAIGKIAYNRKVIENIALSTFGGEEQQLARATGLGHITGYPLLAHEELLGVLAVYTRREAPGDLLLWWRLYAQLSAARLSNELSRQEKDKQINQLSLLFEATRLLNSTLDLAELLELILKIARTEVKADRASVFLVDHKHKELWSIVASGLDHQEIRIPAEVAKSFIDELM